MNFTQLINLLLGNPTTSKVRLAKKPTRDDHIRSLNCWIERNFYLIVLACMTLEEGPILGTIICASTTIFVIVAFYALKLEVDAGYYECKKCHHRFIPNYLTAMFVPHIHTTRYLKCPNCHSRSWAKKVMTK